MISESVEFRDFDGERFFNLSRLLFGDHDPKAGPPGLLILHDRGRLLKALHTHRGSLDPDYSAEHDLSELARANEARWAVAIDAEALDAIHDEASRTFRLGQDLVDLLLLLWLEAERQKESGKLVIWPDIFKGIRPPTREVLERVFDVVLPPKTSALFYVFDGTELFAELLVVRGASQLILIAGHDALDIGPPPRHWQEGYKDLIKACTERFEQPSVGVFVSRRAFVGLFREEVKLSDAMARKELILDPLPLWLAGPLGLTALRDVVEVGRHATSQMIERFAPYGLGARVAGKMAGRLKQAIGDRVRDRAPIKKAEASWARLRQQTNLSEILGFDPTILIERLKKL